MRSFAAIALAGTAAACAAAKPVVPTVTLDYTPVFDRGCSVATKSPTPEGAPEEMAARLEEFRALWAREGPVLLETAVALTGKPFRYRETTAALHVCGGIPSVSLPLSINMRRHLRSTHGRHAGQPEMLVDTVFHEVLHTYVRHTLGGAAQAPANSALLRKYAAEDQVTKNHLHLFALQTAVYRRLGRPEMAAKAKAADVTGANPGPYARGWEIVEAEGADAFVAELRAAP